MSAVKLSRSGRSMAHNKDFVVNVSCWAFRRVSNAAARNASFPLGKIASVRFARPSLSFFVWMRTANTLVWSKRGGRGTISRRKRMKTSVGSCCCCLNSALGIVEWSSVMIAQQLASPTSVQMWMKHQTRRLNTSKWNSQARPRRTLAVHVVN